MKFLEVAYDIFKSFFSKVEIIKADTTQILIAVVEKVNIFNGSCAIPYPSFPHPVSHKIWVCTH